VPRSDRLPTGMNTSPIRVGFTGHRRNKLDSALLALISPQVTSVLRSILSVSESSVEVVTSLADGADLVVADACEQLQIPLICPIPFGVDEFRFDLPTDADRVQFDRHLATAREIQIVAGSRMSRASREATYRALGEQIIAQSDLVLAVWDGMPPAGPGGSAEIVENAQDLDVPVLRINALLPQEVSLVVGDEPPCVGPVFDLVTRVVGKS
jgi:hypothetical protein